MKSKIIVRVKKSAPPTKEQTLVLFEAKEAVLRVRYPDIQYKEAIQISDGFYELRDKTNSIALKEEKV